MGLAASQARFLAITSRKADCEYRSMQIAQEKLSVTRQLAQASADYQNALNQTTLLWQDALVGDATYNLSYGVLMTPSTLNNFNPYLLTTRTGAVVLNSQYAQAARAISSDGSPTGSRSAAGFEKFMQALVGSGIISSDTAAAITGMTSSVYKDANGKIVGNNLSASTVAENGYKLVSGTGKYDRNAGYGSTPLNKNGATSTGLAGLVAKTKDIKLGDLFTDGSKSINLGSWGSDQSLKVYINGKELSEAEAKELSLSDLLTDNVSLVQVAPDGTHSQTKIANINVFVDQLAKSLSSLMGLKPNDMYMLEAKKNTDASFKKITSTVDKAKKLSVSSISKNAIDDSYKYNTQVFLQNKGNKNNSVAAVSLTNIVGTLLTNYELAMNGYASGYDVKDRMVNSNLVIDDPYYTYLFADKDAVTQTDLLLADFYMQLYNNICINGWTDAYASVVEDSDSLTNLLKNGQLFITSLNADGYFYQGRYNDTQYVIEQKNEDAIAQAEAEYTTLKAKLTYKEDKLDLDMKNLDTEISSLTTEYDTVKNLISKNVEKVFTMFQ